MVNRGAQFGGRRRSAVLRRESPVGARRIAATPTDFVQRAGAERRSKVRSVLWYAYL